MRFAFALFKYFPFGGLQSDMLRIAECAAARGHEVTVFTGAWEGAAPRSGIHVRLLENGGGSNHRRARVFAERFAAALKQETFDLSLTFNRFGGCDWYFAADNCLAVEMPRKHLSLLLKLLPRYRSFLEQEREVFSPQSRTNIFYITPRQKRDFMRCYGTPEERFFYLPPGISPEFRLRPDAERIRKEKRRELGVPEHSLMLLEVGGHFFGKGVDRVIRAVAALPEELRERCCFCIAGAAQARRILTFGRRCGVPEHSLRVLGPRKDVPELLTAADLMVHPARNEAAGNVLLEGIASGLPVICSEACGFSDFVAEAGGVVVPEPWSDKVFQQQLTEMLGRLGDYRARIISHGGGRDFCRRAGVAVDLLEQWVQRCLLRKDSHDVPR